MSKITVSRKKVFLICRVTEEYFKDAFNGDDKLFNDYAAKKSRKFLLENIRKPLRKNLDYKLSRDFLAENIEIFACITTKDNKLDDYIEYI